MQLRAQAKERMALDEKRFGPVLSKKIEAQFPVGSKSFAQPEARRPLEQVLASYPQSNRAGCACLYLGRMSQGSEAIRYDKTAIEKYDGWYGHGTQVGPAARYFTSWPTCFAKKARPRRRRISTWTRSPAIPTPSCSVG